MNWNDLLSFDDLKSSILVQFGHVSIWITQKIILKSLLWLNHENYSYCNGSLVYSHSPDFLKKTLIRS